MIRENIFRQRKVDLGGVKMNVAETGEGYPVVLVHGWTNNWKGFIPMAKILRKDYRIIMVDLMGYGDSDKLEKYDLKTEAEYLKKMVDKLGLKKFSLAALSMGTYVISKFYDLYPRRAEKIILISPVFEKGSKKLFFSKNFFEVAKKNSLAELAIKKIVERRIYSYLVAKYVNMHQFDWELIKKYGLEGKRKMTKEVYVEMGVEIAKNNIAQMIKDNQIPIKIIFGKFDKLCNLNKAKKVLKGQGKYDFKEIDGAGHLVTIEKPKETAKEITKFMTESKVGEE